MAEKLSAEIFEDCQKLMKKLSQKKSKSAKRLKRTISLITFEEGKTHGFS